MKIIGCDCHPGYQQIAALDLATGEMVEKALSHERKELLRGTRRVKHENETELRWLLTIALCGSKQLSCSTR